MFGPQWVELFGCGLVEGDASLGVGLEASKAHTNHTSSPSCSLALTLSLILSDSNV